MIRAILSAAGFLTLLSTAAAGDWLQFRGPDGLGVAADKYLPTTWDAKTNIVWKTDLPGPGSSSPIVVGNKIFVTSYSGYGLEPGAGDMKKLQRHLVCLDRATGKILWTRDVPAVQPEGKFDGYAALHGYASSTPISDGSHVFVLFGKSGVFCFDLDGEKKWDVSVGKGGDGFGAGESPIVYQDLLIVNASMESRALIALSKATGKQVWTAKIGRTWCTPLVVKTKERDELVMVMPEIVQAFDPKTGNELWRCKGVTQGNYVCPSPVTDGSVVYALFNNGGIAVKTGGNGDVTETHRVWTLKKGANVTSPIYHEKHLYFAGDQAGQVYCVAADSGNFVYQKPLTGSRDRIYASPLLADGKIYYLTREEGAFVVEASPKFNMLAHNVIAGDKSVSNGSLAVADGKLLLRSNRTLYCIGEKR
jgi:outer membrane protein assembly factor BamB